MKKTVAIVLVIVVVGAAAVYFFMFNGDKEKKDVRVEYSPGDFFTTNVKESTRLLKTSIVLVVNDEGLNKKLETENSHIRDSIIFILRDLTEEEIRATGNQDELRDRVLSTLNERLGIDNFIEVLFIDFVMS